MSLAPAPGVAGTADRALVLRRLVEELEPLALQGRVDCLRERIEVLDRLEMHLLPDHPGHPADDADAAAAGVESRARTLRSSLEAANQALYEALRTDLLQGRPQSMLRHLRACGAGSADISAGEGYDHLDELAASVLRWQEPEPAQAALEDGMVFYQPTPVRHVFDLMERAAPGERDVVVDLGSGLGHVVLLAAISTAARCIGIERDAAYVDSARRSAQALRVRNATFIQSDARTADFSIGTLFYFYTPFLGEVLRAVLDALRAQAAVRHFRIAAFGPCVPVIAGEAWLMPPDRIETGRVALFGPRR